MSKSQSTTLPAQVIDMTGQQFTYLTVFAFADIQHHRARWLCQCQCGIQKIVDGSTLRNGKTQSCGCYNRARTKERATRHGMSHTKIYKIWGSMIQRCTNSNHPNYYRYGGRGIEVSPVWHIFENFFNDIGHAPYPGATLERIDNDSGYFPANTRWATRQEQTNNTRRNHFLLYDRETLTVSQWAHKLNISVKILDKRLRMGWSVARVLTTPIQARYLHLASRSPK